MYKKSNMSRWFSGLGNVFLIAMMLVSSVGLDVTSVSAAPAGTALQFNGSNQYVTFGNTRLTPGTLTNGPTWNTLANSRLGSSSLTLNSTTANQYVTFGAAPELGTTNFTIETWFYRTGAGSGTDTSGVGGGGLQGAIPLLTKGRGEGDYTNVDMNYFLGISSTGRIAADFEDMTAVSPNPNNHAIIGTTALSNNTWYHAAATFDGSTFSVYLNGNLEASVATTAVPRWNSIQHSGLATGLTST
ncbi:MAG TPA: LamG-like jellyroll fold domain-containing protein, partial [Anaerolineales bacterium]|nr:LamG-like jellyroll fold domain-containing protein [Anaerolineales bacterium]